MCSSGFVSSGTVPGTVKTKTRDIVLVCDGAEPVWGHGGKQEVRNTTEICKHNVIGVWRRDFDLA